MVSGYPLLLDLTYKDTHSFSSFILNRTVGAFHLAYNWFALSHNIFFLDTFNFTKLYSSSAWNFSIITNIIKTDKMK